MLDDPRLSFMIFIGIDTKQYPREPWVIDAEHNPSHFHNCSWEVVVVLGNHLLFERETKCREYMLGAQILSKKIFREKEHKAKRKTVGVGKTVWEVGMVGKENISCQPMVKKEQKEKWKAFCSENDQIWFVEENRFLRGKNSTNWKDCDM